MKNIMAGFVTCLGVLSSIFAIEDKFIEYRNVFLVLIGVCVGFFLGQISASESNKTESRCRIPPTVFLFLAPPFALIATLLVIYFTGNLTESILVGILLGGAILVFIFELLIFACASEVDSKESNCTDSKKEEEKENKPQQNPD